MNEKIYQLLAKKMADELSQAEKNELNEWISASEENRQEAIALQKTWSITGDHQEELSIDTDRAWQQLQQTITQKKRSKIRIMTWSAAAAVIIIVGVAWLNLKSEMPNEPNGPVIAQNEVFQTTNEAKTIMLEDETEVRLMPHSTLTVDKGFNKKHRDVKLKGLAHFTTYTSSDKYFTVISKGTRIVDISTSFIVNTNNDKLAVRVTQGTVKVKQKSAETTLHTEDSIWIMGEKLYLYEEPKTEKEEPVAQTEHLKPADKNLEFRNTELSEVVKIINSLYHSNLNIGSESIKTCKFTSTFNNEDLEVIIDILQQSFNLEIVKRNGQTVLLGKGCN